MNEISKPAHVHGDHEHAQGGSCCGGSTEAKAKPQATPTAKAALAPAGATATKPAKSSGCCCG